jgi:hypothetical protein
MRSTEMQGDRGRGLVAEQGRERKVGGGGGGGVCWTHQFKITVYFAFEAVVCVGVLCGEQSAASNAAMTAMTAQHCSM